MEWMINPNAVNQIAKGTDIFVEDDTSLYIALVLKGRVLMHNNGAKVIVGSGNFLGINDLFTGRYQSTYTAYDDLLLYVYSINHIEELEQILSINKDYHGLMVASYSKVITELDQIYQEILKQRTDLYQFLVTKYNEYLESASRLGYQIKSIQRLNDLKMHDNDLEPLKEGIEYYRECKHLPIDVVKAFYSYGNVITLYQIEDQVDIINQQVSILKDLSEELVSLAECLVDESDTCIFRLFFDWAIEIEESDGSNIEMMGFMDSIIEVINKVEKFVEQSIGRTFKANRKMLEEAYHLLLSGTKNNEMSTAAHLKYPKEDSDMAQNDAVNSFQKLLDYAGIDTKRASEMNEAMLNFINLKDRLSVDDNARLVRRQLTDNHYELYKAVFLNAYKDKKTPKIIDLFLKYGFVDERLITKEQLLSIYYLKEEKSNGNCKVYDIKEWLTLVFEGKKNPSKNEFDLEYPEMVAGLKKQRKLSEKEAKEWNESPERKLEFEVQNMFRYNNRTSSGQIGTFVPVLHKDVMLNQMESALVTSKRVNEAVNELMRADYSVFDREIIYSSKERNIVKEYVIKRIYPDIILMPTIGVNAIMWQEISGKRRNSAGRFLLPAFTGGDLVAQLVRIFGRYRWELCRSIEGSAWNNIKYKSLTSEYSDYVQFYRKNRELSEEKKLKIKKQIQKGRNSSREIFVIDYEIWINFESKGAIKLNKLVREMMATYCPFSKELRERIKGQPLFGEAMARYYKEKQKKKREIEARYRYLKREQIELTQELIDTLSYYENL